MIEQLYFIKYKPDERCCPIYTGGTNLKDNEWTGEHEWNYNDPDPFKYQIKSEYGLRMDEPYINLDYCKDFVSNKFLELLDELKVKYRAIPLKIILNNKKVPSKEYFILLLSGRYFLLDEKKSKYTLAYHLRTKEIIYSKIDPTKPSYDVIDSFYVKNIDTPHYFICEEISDVLCTETFKDLAIEKQILGIEFEKVEEGFTYDPWKNFSDSLKR